MDTAICQCGFQQLSQWVLCPVPHPGLRFQDRAQPREQPLPIVSHGLALTLLSLRKVAFTGRVHIMVVIRVITEYVKFLLSLSARNHDGYLAS